MHKGYNVGLFWWSIFCIFEIIIVCFIVDICDLVQNVYIAYVLLTASGNLF